MVQVLRKGILAGLLVGYICLGGAAPYTALHHAAAWQHADQIYINDSGTWRRIKRKWEKDGGTWRMTHVGLLVNGTALSCGTGGQVMIRFLGGQLSLRGASGTCSQTDPSLEWFGDSPYDAAFSGQYEARVTVTGTNFIDPEFQDANTWYGIGSTLSPVQWIGSSGVNGTATWTLEIRDTATQNVRISASFPVTQSGN